MQALKPSCPNRKPIEYIVEPGKTYWWCSCGKSSNQPFCDGSHPAGFAPVKFEPSKEEKVVVFCQCKRTGNKPYCDGSHSNNKLDW